MPYHIFLQQHYYCTTWVRYIIIETREFSRIGYNGFLFPHSYSGDGLGATYAPRPSPEYECVHQGRHLSTNACTNAVTWVRMSARRSSPEYECVHQDRHLSTNACTKVVTRVRMRVPRPSPEYECVHQGRHPSTNACTKTVTWVRMRKNKPVLSNTGRFFCFNSTVIYTCTESNIDVVLKASRAVVIMWFSLNEAPLGLFKFISD